MMPNDTLANVPAVVAVTFIKSINGDISARDRVVFNVHLSDLGLTEYTDMIGHIGTTVIKSAAIGLITTSYEASSTNTDDPPPSANWTDLAVITEDAIDWDPTITYSPSQVVQIPDNYNELKALADQIATDYYLWKLASLELRLTSYVLIDGDGGHDLEFWHDDPTTVIHRSGWEPDTGELIQSGEGGSVDPDEPTTLLGLNKTGQEINISKIPEEWVEEIVYEKGWIVTRLGVTYQCLLLNYSEVGVNDPPNATYWLDVTGQDLRIVNIPDQVMAINGNYLPRQIIGVSKTGSDLSVSTSPVIWRPDRVYRQGDLVIDSMVLYRAIAKNFNFPPPDIAHWMMVTEILPGWSSTQQYQIGWALEHLGAYYYCFFPSLNNEPPDPDYWAEVTEDAMNIINFPPSLSGIVKLNEDTTKDQTIGLGVFGSDINIRTVPVAYSSGQLYQPGWVVSSGSDVYFCILASLGNDPPNPTYWRVVTGQGLTVLNIPRQQVTTPSGTATGNPVLAVASIGNTVIPSGSGNTINLEVNYDGPCKCLPPGVTFGDTVIYNIFINDWVIVPACPPGFSYVFDPTSPTGVSCKQNCCPDVPKFWYCLEPPAGYPTKDCCEKPLPEVLQVSIVIGSTLSTSTATYNSGSGKWVGTGSFGTCDRANWTLECTGGNWVFDLNGTTYTAAQASCDHFTALFVGVDLTSCGETTGGVVTFYA